MKTSFRRLLSLFLAACILLCCVPAAFAEGPAFTDTADAAKYVRGKMVQRGTGIQFTYETDKTAVGELNEENLKAAMQKAWDEMLPVVFEHTGVGSEGDYLRQHVIQYGFNAGVSYAAGDDAVSIRFTVNATYYTTAAQESSVTAAVAKALKELDLNGKLDYEKVRAITDYICGKVAYDYENLNNDAYTLKQSAYAALINGKAVCQGYASLFYRMALEAGLDCRIITGEADNGEGKEAHAWNIVKVDGKYYNIDPTWIDGTESDQFFLKSKSSFYYDHSSDNDFLSDIFLTTYPISYEDYNPIQVDKNGNLKGVAGNNAFWTLNKEGILTITGTGEIFEAFISLDSYLCGHRNEIMMIVIKEGITAIGDSAFYKCENAKTVSLPNSLERLGCSAFAFCISLTSISIPDKVTVLSRELFFRDDNITEINLPKNTKEIQYQSLSLLKLHQITVPASVEKIDNGAFFMAGIDYVFYEGTQSQWEKIVNYQNNDCLKTAKIIYSYRDGQTVILDKGECGEQGDNLKWTIDNKNTMTISGKGRMKDYYDILGYFPCHPWIYCPSYATVKTIVIQEGVENITDFAFVYSNAERVIIANSVTNISSGAFFENESIKIINLPDALSIDDGYFVGHLSAVEKIDVSEKCQNYHTDRNCVLFNKRNCLLFVPISCKKVIIPKESNIMDSAFIYARLLECVEVESGNTTYHVENGMLYQKTAYGNKVLLYCPAKIPQTQYDAPQDLMRIASNSFSNNSTLRKICLPYHLDAINYCAFKASAIEEIVMPFELIEPKEINNSDCLKWFMDCKNLKAARIPKGIQTMRFSFDGCSSLETVSLPDTLKNIGTNSFFGCSALKQIEIPDSVTTIEEQAFAYCSSLEHIEIPDSVEETGTSVFFGCESLQTVKLSRKMTQIPDLMFAYCNSLRQVYIPKSIKTIDYGAFLGCSDLTFIFEETEDKIDINFIGEDYEQVFANAKKVYGGKHTHQSVSDPAVPAVCTIDGKTEGSHCSLCGTALKAQTTVKAAGHKWNAGKVTKTATCTEDGEKTYTCSVCKTTKTETVKATGHTAVTDKAVAASCTKDGKTEGSHCSLCGTVLKAQTTVKATGHKWDDGKVTKEATAVSDGEKTFTCTVCGETKTEAISKLSDKTGKILLGDVDKDSGVTAADARLALRAAVGLENYAVDSQEFLAADATKDGAITAEDARLILRAAVGLETLS